MITFINILTRSKIWSLSISCKFKLSMDT